MSETDVLGKADALMKRHRRAFVAAGAGKPSAAVEDVPVLTEVIAANQAAHALAERMREPPVSLPPEIARALEDWLAAALPRLVSRQLDGIAGRITEEVGAALREGLPRLIADLARANADRTKPK